VAGALPPVYVHTYISSSASSLGSVTSSARRVELEAADAAADRREAEAAAQRRAAREEEERRMVAEEETAAERRVAATREEEEDWQRETERRRAAAARATRAADLRTEATRAAEEARRTRAVAIRQEQEAAQLQEELEVKLEVVRPDLEELGHTAQGAGHDVPPVNAAALGARPPPQEVPAGDAARQRDAEVHGWVPDPRHQDVERRSVHDHDYDHDDFNHDDAPPRVVKTVIRDSGSTQWPVLTKTNDAEWSSMMKVKLEARQMWTAVRLGGVSRQED
jgi:flagellar biosynthesis GTPase FlhF